MIGRALESVRSAQRQALAVGWCDELEPDRQALARKSAWHRERRLLREVERIAERRPPGPVILGAGWLPRHDTADLERCHGERRRRQQIPVEVEAPHPLTDRHARSDRIEVSGERVARAGF